MALRKEPQHRYSSAEQLSEDLRRHLDGLPVFARKPTLLYRSGKFVQRNRPWVIVAGVIVALLLTAVLVTSREANIANIERLHAEQRFNDVHELADSFLFEFDDSIKNLRGSTPARELVVRKALLYLNRLKVESEADASLQMDLVRAYLKVGDIQGSPYTANLGDLKGALETYKKGQQIALVLSRSHPHDRSVQLLLAKTYHKVGGAQLFGGDPQEAVTNLNRAVELLRPLSSSSDANVDAELALINSYTELGDAYGHGSVVNLGQPRKAMEFFQDALTLCQNALSAHPENTSLRENLAIAETKIGDVLLGEGELNGAVEHHRNALKDFTAIASFQAENATAKREVSIAESRLARSLWQRGDRREAIELDRKAQAIAEDLYAADPANMQAKFDLAVGLRNLSEELAATHNFAEAVNYFRRAIDLVSELAAADPTNLERQAQLGEGLVSFGHLLGQSGRGEEAQSQSRRGLDIERSLAASKIATADQKLTYAYALLTCDPKQLRNPSGSLEFARQAEKMDPNDPDVLNVLASADFALGNVRQAAETEGQALTLIGQHSGGDTFFSANVIRANLEKFTKALDASGPAESRVGRNVR
jgi:eukaryotic-like serine/threonine-protein kinase